MDKAGLMKANLRPSLNPAKIASGKSASSAQRKRVLSGIKSSGDVTIGNYIGAMQYWANISKDPLVDSFFFVPDLHVLNTHEKNHPEELREHTFETMAWLIAAGIDTKNSNIFLQSSLSEHSELSWILENYTYESDLKKMTQYKDKKSKNLQDKTGVSVALFTYPVLMAADILLYGTDEVPVGQDQKQHVELTRDIAERFNKKYGTVFKLPKAVIPIYGDRVMNLQNPEKKMSKSDQGSKGVVLLKDGPDVVRKKISAAVTDSSNMIKYSPNAQNKSGINNLIVIYSALSGRSISAVQDDYSGKGFSVFKSELADLVISVLTPMQKEYNRIHSSQGDLIKILRQGRSEVQGIARSKLDEVKEKIGLLHL